MNPARQRGEETDWTKGIPKWALIALVPFLVGGLGYQQGRVQTSQDKAAQAQAMAQEQVYRDLKARMEQRDGERVAVLEQQYRELSAIVTDLGAASKRQESAMTALTRQIELLNANLSRGAR